MKNRILLLGSSGYIGSVFKSMLPEKRVITMKHSDITVQNLLNSWSFNHFDTIINCAGYVGRPNVDAVEKNKEEGIFGNIIIPQIITEFLNIVKDLTLLHISSGCVYEDEGSVFTEEDKPNLDWEASRRCSFYSGTKGMAEKIVSRYPNHYICRLRMPFDEDLSNPRNYLSKLFNYEKLLSLPNSLSNRHEFVQCCIQLLEKECEFGTYNIVNSGFITAKQVVDIFEKHKITNKEFKFFSDIEDFYLSTGSVPRSNCRVSNQKLLNAGVQISNVHDSIENCVKKVNELGS